MKRINLIPEEGKKPSFKRWFNDYAARPLIWRFILILAVLFVFINLWQAVSILRYRMITADAKGSIKRLEARLSEIKNESESLKVEKEKIDKEAKSVEEKLNLLNQARAQNIAWAATLSRLSKLLPDNLWVNKVTLSKDEIKIIGATLDNSIVSSFMATLDESGYFKDTGFTYTKKAKVDEREVIDFEVNTHLVLEKILR